jgi:hypothetical protein
MFVPILAENHELEEAPVGVIPSGEGIRESWMSDPVSQDKARTSADFLRPQDVRSERMDSGHTIFNVSLVPIKLLRIAV